MSERPFMQLYVSDFIGDTLQLSTEQIGSYMLLLMAMWNAGGTLPDDDAKLARVVRLTVKKWRAISDDLYPYFDRSEGVISHNRLTFELRKSKRKSQSRAAAGEKGGRAKSLKNHEQTLAIAVANEKQNPKHLPDTITIKKESSRNSDSKYPDDFEAFWKTWKAKGGGGDKSPAHDAWKKLNASDREFAASVAVPWFEAWRKAAPDATAIHASTYLNKRRFDGFEPPTSSKSISMAGKSVVTNADPLWPALVERKRQETGRGVNADSWAFDDAWIEDARSTRPTNEDLDRGRQMQGLLSSVSGNA